MAMGLFDTGTYMKVPVKMDPELYQLLRKEDNQSDTVRKALGGFFSMGLSPLKVKEIPLY